MIDLITGYKGTAHITAAEDAMFNAGLIGNGNYVYMVGNKFAYQIISNNCVRILDGLAIFQGRKFHVEDYEDVIIDTGNADKYRNDLICARYEKDTSTGVESMSFVVKKGAESDTAASDPEYTSGNMNGGATVVEVPLYRVKLTALDITSVEKMDDWAELPAITALGFASAVTYETTIGTAWTAESSVFKQIIEVAGIKSTDDPIVDLVTTTSNFKAEQEAFGKVFKITTDFNKITAYASEETETAVNIQLKVVR